jgi:hypothetical protein
MTETALSFSILLLLLVIVMTLDKITRTEYIENSSELHHAYYSQFVTPQTIAFVNSQIGLKKLKASDDPHLNDVARWEQGGKTWLWDRSPINTTLAKELGEGSSMSTHTCVGKAAARIILEEAS